MDVKMQNTFNNIDDDVLSKIRELLEGCKR